MSEPADWARSALARALRPLVRLGLALGLKYGDLDQLLRGLLLDEARRLARERGNGRPNVSQLSVTTGLHRKEVTARVRAEADPLPVTDQSAASRVFTRWLQHASLNPAFRRLPRLAPPGELSFESLAREASRGDVHHRAVLDELVRLGLAQDEAGEVVLCAEAFVPDRDRQSMLAFLGDNSRDHLLAAVANTLGQSPPFLERAVFADGIDLPAAQAVQQLARDEWVGLHHKLVGALTDAVQAPGDHKNLRMRVGVYTYFEPLPDERPDAQAAPEQDAD